MPHRALLDHPVTHLIDLLHGDGEEARVVGGSVRDARIGAKPKDIDIATTALPEKAKLVLARAGIETIDTGLQHGTITALVDAGTGRREGYEITTLRIDAACDGRHAEVVFTSDWKKDAERRDFTFNAMSVARDGTLHDYFDGQADLLAGRVAFVGDADLRIQEDYLRILRWFRFHGRFGRDGADNRVALAAIARNAGGLERISGERFWQEMSKIAMHHKAAAEIGRMAALGVAEAICFPTALISDAAAVATRMPSLDPIGPIAMSPVARLSVLLPDLDAVERLDRRWKFSADERNEAIFLVQNRGRENEPLTTWQRFILDTHDDKPDENGVMRENPVRAERRTQVARLLALAGRRGEAEALATWRACPFPITGADLIAAGIPAGPERGRVMRSLRERWVEDGCPDDREGLLAALGDGQEESAPQP